jgi:hypothetical protein
MLLATLAILLSSVSPARAVVVGLWEYETSAGVPVTVGQSAVGQVDDTGGYAGGPFYGTGHGGTLSYRAGAVGSSHSLQFTEATSPYDYVDRAMPAAIAGITQGAFTIETWFKTTDTGRGVLIGSYDGAADDLNFEVYNGNVRGHINSAAGTTDLFSSGHAGIADGQWHHAAFVRDSALGTAKLYLDGVQRGAKTDVAGSFTLARPKIYLGRDGRTDATRFNGYLDNTRISNAALTPEQFHISGDGEQNYYRMETDGGLAVSAGQSASVVDDTGLHPFTYNGAALPASAAPRYSGDVAGRWIDRGGALALNARSLSFNGAGNYVELGDQPLLTTLPQDDFTLEFFLKTPPRSDRAVIVGTFDGSTTYVMNLEIGGTTHGANKGHLRPFFGGNGGYFQDFWSGTNISDNAWHHVALVRSGAGTGSDLVQLFVDYELDGQMALNTGLFTLRPDFFRLGGDSRGSGYYYQGLLDEFRISREALVVDDFLRAVPEPESFMLLTVAGVGLLLRRRRKDPRHNKLSTFMGAKEAVCGWSKRKDGSTRPPLVP